ncbi:MAG: DUF2378 family protein [Myxococcota bacterium]
MPSSATFSIVAWMNGTRIKGASLLARLEWTERKQPGAKQRVLAEIQSADRHVLGGLVMTMGWYSLELCARLDAAIAKVLAPDEPPEKIYRLLGHASAADNLSGAHRLFLRDGTPHGVLSRFPQVRAQYYTDGVATYEYIAPDHARIVVEGAASVTAADCTSTAGYFEEALELSGARDARVEHHECLLNGGARCTFECRWR